MLNLDFECAKISEQIKNVLLTSEPKARKEAESLITKAIGVLQEDGIYAFYLYLKARQKPIYTSIEEETMKLLKMVFPSLNIDRQGHQVARDLVSDLDKILLAKELLERVLIYSRYHAKALGEGMTGGEET